MDLELSSDQQLLVDTTRRYLETESPLTKIRELHDHGGGFERLYWQRGAELGWTSMLVPADQGGGSLSGAGLVDLTLVAEEMGRLVAPGPLLTVNVVCSALARAIEGVGGPDQQRRALADLLSGEAVATWAFAEPGGPWDAGGVRLAAWREPSGGWTLEGTKTAVPEADHADWLLVTTRTGEGLTQFLVPKSTPGLTITPLESLDMVRRYATVHFAGASVPEWAVVGPIGGASPQVEHQLDVSLALQNAETVGATDRVFEFTLQYCKDRVSFGRPIGSYQAIKHRLADMKLWLEACHATAVTSARAVASQAPEASELVSVAKSYIADRAPAIIQDCIQMHGGIGVTWDADLHLYLRRVAQNGALYGTVRDHRERIAVLLGM
jgi:alkylation response protein AidB-like acyl-CoA dehydrogenase